MVPGLDADPLLDAVGRTSTPSASSRTSGSSPRTAPRPRTIPSSSCSTPGSSTTTATGTSPSTTPKPRRRHRASGCGIRNAGPDEATLHVLPTDLVPQHVVVGPRRPQAGHRRQGRRAGRRAPRPRPHGAGRRRLAGAHCSARTSRTPSGCGASTGPAFPKDGIGDHVVHGAATVNPERAGTKAALWYRLTVPAGEIAELRLRLSPDGAGVNGEWETGDGRPRARSRRVLRRPDAGWDDAPTRRGCCARPSAGMLWSKQFFHFDVDRWLDGDPALPAPPEGRKHGRNHEWRHLNNADVISMPDKWEYPWYAAWDLAFHCVPLALVDRPVRQGPAAPAVPRVVHAPQRPAPRLRVGVRRREPAGARVGGAAGVRARRLAMTTSSSQRIFQKLLLNFTWWVNRKDAAGQQRVRGRLPRPRQHRPHRPLGPAARGGSPGPGRRDGVDGHVLPEPAGDRAGPRRARPGVRGHGHQVLGALRLHRHRQRGLWDEEGGFYHDVLHLDGGDRVPLRVRSVVGLLPLAATTTFGPATFDSACPTSPAGSAGSRPTSPSSPPA